MGLRDWPQDPFEDSVERFAKDLRALRGDRPLRAMERPAKYSRTTLNRAEQGRDLPSLEITAAYVRAVGGSDEDVARWKERWQRLHDHLKAQQPSPLADTPGDVPSEHSDLQAEELSSTTVSAEPSADKPPRDVALIPPESTNEDTHRESKRPPIGPTGSPLTPSRHSVLWATATLVTLAAVIALFLSRGGAPPDATPATATPSPSTHASFQVPLEGEEVASPFLARGTAELPPDTALWLLTQPPDGAYYSVGTEPVALESGDWVASVSLGRGERDVGLAYDLHAVIAPASGSSLTAAVSQAEGTGSSARFDSLPADVTHVARVHVILGKRGP
jgi:DNA-binding XRE family transcriptional regulator